MAIRKPKPISGHHSEPQASDGDTATLRTREAELPGIVRHHTRGLLRRQATVRQDGTLSIPAELRRVLALEPGRKIEMEITTGGCLLIHPPDGVDAEQWWWRTDELSLDGDESSVAEPQSLSPDELLNQMRRRP